MCDVGLNCYKGQRHSERLKADIRTKLMGPGSDVTIRLYPLGDVTIRLQPLPSAWIQVQAPGSPCRGEASRVIKQYYRCLSLPYLSLLSLK